MKKYMVIEKFKPNRVDEIYRRLSENGRMLPNGLNYIDSWVNKEKNICFQLMETKDINLFTSWISKWEDLVQFKIVAID